jgi:NTP pyrophosphatase (non-canonical NTP hydrolase)
MSATDNERTNDKMKHEITDHECDALSVVAAKVFLISKEHGFHDGDEIGEVGLDLGRIAKFCANLHGEVSELWEAARKGNLFDKCDKEVSLNCAEEELADVVIRAFDMAHTLGLDIGRAMALKSAYNERREHMHGKLA